MRRQANMVTKTETELGGTVDNGIDPRFSFVGDPPYP